MNVSLLIAAVVMGFLGSPHCLGMCGGIVCAFGISMQGVSATKKSWLIALYHAGRLMSYMLLGGLAGLVGTSVFMSFVQNSGISRLILGLALVFAALLMLGLPILRSIERIGLGLWTKLAPVRSKLFPLTTTPKALGAGLLWGFLPCGLVYGAMLVAVGAGTTKTAMSGVGFGVLFMFAFGLGTIPMLVATQGTMIWLQTRIQRFSLRKVSGIIMLVSGIFVAMPALTHNHAHNYVHNYDSQSPQDGTADNAHVSHTPSHEHHH